MNIVVYVLLGAIGAALLVLAVRKHFFRFARVFIGEMVGELQKATWPTKTELRDSTVVVIVAAAILGVFTAISDFAMVNVVDLVTSLVN